MDKNRILLAILIGLIVFGTTASARHVDVITVDGPITPVTAKYIEDAVEKAERGDAECLIIQLDTPGGLMQSTMKIDKRLLSARVPVVVYVTPSGGRAASAGVFITYAAHVAAMAPSTNIGSAHPVSMGAQQDTSQVMLEKVTNDAVAHMKGLAAQRGRNAEWAEQAVRESVNITEEEALALGVIDLVAEDLIDLLDRVDGMEVEVQDGEVILDTKRVEVRHSPMNWRYRILDKISDPNIAYLLMLAGIIGIFFELQNPGAIFPGALGGISLILAFFALQVLPINAAGILLILLAVVFFILEVNITSYGLLTIGGLVSMTLGSLMLFRTPEIRVSLSIIIPAVLGTAAFFIFAMGMALRAQMRKATTGQKGLIGERGAVVRAVAPDSEGQVSVHGEIWKAVCPERLKKGDRIEVTEVNGLVVTVKKIES